MAVLEMRRLETGDLVIIDMGATVDGYRSDVTRTFAVEEASERARGLHAAVLTAHAAAAAEVRAGMPCEGIDTVARACLEDLGLGDLFVHRTGHGLGLAEHEWPSLVGGDLTVLAANMVVTVEPGVYVPGCGGVRIEDALLVGEERSSTLTNARRDLVVATGEGFDSGPVGGHSAAS